MQEICYNYESFPKITSQLRYKNLFNFSYRLNLNLQIFQISSFPKFYSSRFILQFGIDYLGELVHTATAKLVLFSFE